MTDPRPAHCANCGEALMRHFATTEEGHTGENLNEVLRITLSGAYGELLDTFDGDLTALLCRGCAKDLLATHPWLADLAAKALDINVGHTCLNGDLLWIPMSECPHDPDQHGWAAVKGR